MFPDPGMTVAAIDRLVHHSTIFEMNVESCRRRTASDKQTNRAALLDASTRAHHGAIETRSSDTETTFSVSLPRGVELQKGADGSPQSTGLA